MVSRVVCSQPMDACHWTSKDRTKICDHYRKLHATRMFDNCGCCASINTSILTCTNIWIYVRFIYLHVYIFIYLYICIFIYWHIFTFAYLYVYVWIYSYVYILIYLFINILIYLYINIFIYLHLYNIHIFIYLFLYSYIYIFIYL